MSMVNLRKKLASEGIRCPYYSPQESKCASADGEYYLGADDLKTLQIYGDTLSPDVFRESEVSPLTMEVAEKLRRWLSSPRPVSLMGAAVGSEEGSVGVEGGIAGMSSSSDDTTCIVAEAADSTVGLEKEDKTAALIKATSTPCPTCGVGETHFHGHGCHHVRDGCGKCKIEYCCVCLQSADQNMQLRGRRDVCLCPSRMGPPIINWTTWCKEEDVLDHLKLEPYPHDDRCGCCICPECRPGRPCGTCHGEKRTCISFAYVSCHTSLVYLEYGYICIVNLTCNRL